MPDPTGNLPLRDTVGEPNDPAILFRGIHVSFGRMDVVRDVGFEVARGEFVSLIGPSGCGKTTFLNLAAGINAPDDGTVEYGGRPLMRANTKAGYLTQEDALLPWRDVLSNVALPLEIKGVKRSEREDRAHQILGKFGLAGFERHRPSQLSGGMRKRVSLARTLIYQPETLLLDEPFGALDAQTRILIQEELLSICDELNLTVLLVTHDIAEAIGLSDRVVLFSRRPATVCNILKMHHGPDRKLTHVEPENEKYFDEIWEHLRCQADAATP